MNISSRDHGTIQDVILIDQYEVHLLETGNLNFVVIDDLCKNQQSVFQGLIDLETGKPSTTRVSIQ